MLQDIWYLSDSGREDLDISGYLGWVRAKLGQLIRREALIRYRLHELKSVQCSGLDYWQCDLFPSNCGHHPGVGRLGDCYETIWFGNSVSRRHRCCVAVGHGRTGVRCGG